MKVVRRLESSELTADNALAWLVLVDSVHRDAIVEAIKVARRIAVRNKIVRLLRFIGAALDVHREYWLLRPAAIV